MTGLEKYCMGCYSQIGVYRIKLVNTGRELVHYIISNSHYMCPYVPINMILMYAVCDGI